MQDKAQSHNNPQSAAHYETRDVNIKGIIFFGIAIAIICVLGDLGVGKLMRRFESRAMKADRLAARSQVLPSISRAAPYLPFPREQPSPPEEFATFRTHELGELNSYGWIDKKAGIVRLPIDRAMDLLLLRGVPSRTSAQDASIGPSSLELQQKHALSVTPSKPEEQR